MTSTADHAPDAAQLLEALPDCVLTVILEFSVGGWQHFPQAIAQLTSACVRIERDSLYGEVLALALSRDPAHTTARSSTRSSKRLKVSSKVGLRKRIDAARKRQDNAHFQLLEMVANKAQPLSLARLRAALKGVSDDGTLDVNRVNYINSSTLLVDVCRSRHVGEGVILKCLKDLVARGADCNKRGMDEGMTALAVSRWSLIPNSSPRPPFPLLLPPTTCFPLRTQSKD